jgi:hypothetical protein
MRRLRRGKTADKWPGPSLPLTLLAMRLAQELRSRKIAAESPVPQGERGTRVGRRETVGWAKRSVPTIIAQAPHPQRRKSDAGPPRKGEVCSLLLRYDQTCGLLAATRLGARALLRLPPQHEGVAREKRSPYGSYLAARGRLSARQQRRLSGAGPCFPVRGG